MSNLQRHVENVRKFGGAGGPINRFSADTDAEIAWSSRPAPSSASRR